MSPGSARPRRAVPSRRPLPRSPRGARSRRASVRVLLRRIAELHARARGRPRDADHARAGQAARRGEGRSRVRRVVLRVVRAKRRAASTGRRFPRHRRDARVLVVPGADRRRRGDHAVELPGGDDRAQGRARTRGRLQRRREAGRGDAAHGARARGDRRARGAARRRAQRRDGRSSRRRDDRRRAHVERGRALPLLHRLDRRRQAADGAVRTDREARVPRARRQRAVPGLRRRRSRRRRRRRDRVQVPQRGPDLRVRESRARAGRHPRPLRRARWRSACARSRWGPAASRASRSAR